MDEQALASLIRRAQKRDPAAFEALVDAYARRLYGFLYRLTGSRDDADDLLQETFLRVVRTIEGYCHDGRFEAWLFRIAMNLARDRLRRVRRAPGPGVPDSRAGSASQRQPAGIETVPDEHEAAPHARIELADEIDRLQRALDQLSPAEREVIMLRHFSGLSFKQIAELLDTPIGTALARAHRGLQRLRDLMGPEP